MREIYLCNDRDYYEIIREGLRFKLAYLTLRNGEFHTNGFIVYRPTTRRALIEQMSCNYNKVIRIDVSTIRIK